MSDTRDGSDRMRDDGAVHIEDSGDLRPEIRALDALVMAIYSEQSAFDLYQTLAETIVNQHGQATFRGLADDEKRHRQLLETRYREESAGRSFLFDSKRVKRIHLTVDSQANAIDAVDLAIAAEKAASEFYRKAAYRTVDVGGKRMFESLAEGRGSASRHPLGRTGGPVGTSLLVQCE